MRIATARGGSRLFPTFVTSIPTFVGYLPGLARPTIVSMAYTKRRKRTTAAALVGMLTMASCSLAEGEHQEWEPDTRVSTERGDIVGFEDDDVLRYHGIPYAEPPVGDLRFAAPEPVTAWDGELDATDQGSQCVQRDDTGGASGQEDCLYLDITVPNSASEQPRPVMVWLHGGGFSEGNGTDYDPRRLAVEGDAIVVTLNYRLGALGLMAAPGMPDGGTFSLADQQEAMRFVQENAASFGGDADNVTLFGQSAGGTAVCHHLASPSADGLFHQAIIQSAIECGAPAPPYAYGLPPDGGHAEPPSMHIDDVEARGAEAAAGMGCTGEGEELLACLRGLAPEEFLVVQESFTLPANGGDLVPETPIERLNEVDIPVLTGFTRDESRFYAMTAALVGAPYPSGSYEPAIQEAFGDRAEAVLREYPRENFDDDAEAWSAVYTDATFACPQVHANDVLSQSTTVYAYEFADHTAPPPLPPVPGAPEPGAAHMAEVPYLFDRESQPIDVEGNKIPFTPEQEELAARMVDVWTDFAHSGEVPVAPWAEGGESLVFEADGVTTGDPRTTYRCDVWTVGDRSPAGQ